MITDLVAVLRNPVGRAMAIPAIRSSITTSLLKLAFKSHGDRCATEVAEVGDVMTIIGMAVDRERSVGADDHRPRIIAGAVSACANMIKVDRFDSRQMAAVEAGAMVAMEILTLVKPKTLYEAALLYQANTGRAVDARLRSKP